jgi:hypothetical protein
LRERDLPFNEEPVKATLSMHGIVDRLAAIYEESVGNLREALSAYVRDGTAPTRKARAGGCFAYPELRIDYAGKAPRPLLSRAFARLNQPGVYAASIALAKANLRSLPRALQQLYQGSPEKHQKQSSFHRTPSQIWRYG